MDGHKAGLTRAGFLEREGGRVGAGIQVTGADAGPLVDSRSLAADEYDRAGRVASHGAGLQLTTVLRRPRKTDERRLSNLSRSGQRRPELSLRLTGTGVIVRLGGIPERPRHLAKRRKSRGLQRNAAPGDLIKQPPAGRHEPQQHRDQESLQLSRNSGQGEQVTLPTRRGPAQEALDQRQPLRIPPLMRPQPLLDLAKLLLFSGGKHFQPALFFLIRVQASIRTQRISARLISG